MTDVQRMKKLKVQLELSSNLTENLYYDLLDVIGDKCRGCSKQKDCWKPTKFCWLAEVSLKGGEEWECANYTPLSCASVIGRPLAVRTGR